jgi:peptide/nickel transport system substrate-binding protein
MRGLLFALSALFAFSITTSMAGETPKRGGTLTFIIPAEAPPSLDGHREGTFATVHLVAPFYSLLMRVDPQNPSDTTRFDCDLCTTIPAATDDGKTYAFKIREGVKFQDGTSLTAADVAASWRHIIFPPQGVLSARQNYFSMVESVEAPDPTSVVFRLKFATAAFLPALADPFAFIYEKKILDDDPHWYETHIMGSGPFRPDTYTIGQSMTGVRDPGFYRTGLPYLDRFEALLAPKEAVRIAAIRAERAAIEFRGFPPSARDALVSELHDAVTVQTSDWNCHDLVTPNASRKPFDDVRVRRALLLAIDQWGSSAALSKIAILQTVGGIVFPGSPLAATKQELQQMTGFWPDIEKSRAEARRLLKEAGAEGLTFELLVRNVDQPYKFGAIWLVDQWSKIGVHVSQKVVPTGPWFAAMRAADFSVVLESSCPVVVNPILDVQKYLPHELFVENYGYYKDQVAADIYEKMLHEKDPNQQRTLMRAFEKQVVDVEAHEFPALWWNRIVVHRSYVKGWKISPSHFINQDLANVWLDKSE